MMTLIVIPAVEQPGANTAAKAYFDSVGGELTFSVPLNASGSPEDPPSHFWCCAAFGAEKRALLDQMLPMFPGTIVEDFDDDTNPGRPDEMLVELGLKRITTGTP